MNFDLNTMQPVVVVCAADDNYAMPLTVTLRSVIENYHSRRKLALFIIDGGISHSNQRKIAKSLAKPQVDLEFLQPQTAFPPDMKLSRRMTLAIYNRLLIPDLLPLSFSKAIYLDSDLIVKANLAQLWEIEIEENYVLAVQDMYVAYVSSKGGLKNYQELGILADSKYFNSGVLVINLDKWRFGQIATKVIEYVRANKEIMTFHDQEGLNALLAGKWGELDLRWNQIPYIYEYNSWANNLLKQQIQSNYDEILNNPYIIHFSSGRKPWRLGCKHPRKMEFFHYLRMTAWTSTIFLLYAQQVLEFFQYFWWKLNKSIRLFL
jgi:lipopolysaccharide biosynthesis glycosyltransferase